MTGPKLLSKFIEGNNLPMKGAADALGVSRTALYYWLTGSVTPGESARSDIDTWTRGAVPPASWGPVHDSRRRKAKVRPFTPKPRAEG